MQQIKRGEAKSLTALSSDPYKNAQNLSILEASKKYNDLAYGDGGFLDSRFVGQNPEQDKDLRNMGRLAFYADTGFTNYFENTGATVNLLLGGKGAEESANVQSPNTLASAALREYYTNNGEKFNIVVQDVVTNIAQNTVPMLLSIAGAGMANSAAISGGKTLAEAAKTADLTSRVISTASFAPSVFGSAYKEGLQSGITDKNKLLLYSFATTAAECGLEMALGSTINPAGGVLSGKLISNFSQKFSNVFAKAALKVGGNGIGELVEEGTQSILSPLFKEWFLGTEETTIVDDPIGALSDAAYDGFIGFVSSILMSGYSSIQSAKSEASIQANGKLYKGIAEQTNTNIKDIAQFFKETFSDKTLVEAADRIIKGDTSDMAVGELISASYSHSEESGKLFYATIGQNIEKSSKRRKYDVIRI